MGRDLKSPESYIAFLKERFGPEFVEEEIEQQAYTYIIDPPSMKEFLVGHMNMMWKSYLQPEWARVEPILLDSVRSFSNTDLTKMPREEAALFVTGQDICSMKWCERYKTAEKVIFIPNPHLGPYVHSASMSEIFYVYFGARKSEGMGERIPELERTEIVSRLSAFADDTRLHILQLAAERGEIRVQDLLEVIDLSQPSISRYLTQLTGSGYLQERREDGAKVYILNKDRIQKTLKALSAFLLGD